VLEGIGLNGNSTTPYSKKLRKYCPPTSVDILTDVVFISGFRGKDFMLEAIDFLKGVRFSLGRILQLMIQLGMIRYLHLKKHLP